MSPLYQFLAFARIFRRLHRLRDNRESGSLRWAFNPFSIDSELASNTVAL